MTPDGTDSFSAAKENTLSPKGIHVTEPDSATGPEVEKYAKANVTSWSYLFVHHCKVSGIETRLAKDGITYFVHKTMRYIKKTDGKKVLRQEMPTISGLIFLQGSVTSLASYLKDNFPFNHLCKNCSTGRYAEIPDAQMLPFMRISETSPERIRFLLHPFHYYARNHIKLRVTTGDLAGLEGYVIRIARDRRLVMDVGGISMAISGVHAEKFEEAEPHKEMLKHEHIFYQRNLHERQALIDRYFHPVKTAQEVKAQAENIDYLRNYVLSERAAGRMNIYEAWSIFSFIIEEIGYYYAPFVDQFKKDFDPIMQQGGRVMREMECFITNPCLDGDTKCRYETELQELLTKYEYLF